MDGAGEAAHGVGHEAGVAAHLGFAHVALQFGLGNQGRHRVDDHQIHRAGTHQHVRDVQSLLAIVRLGDKQVVGIHAQALGIGHVQSVLGVHKGAGAALLLALGDDVQGKRGLARGFGAENFGNPTARDAAHAQGQIQTDGPGGDHGDIDMGLVGQFHHRALAVFALNGAQRGVQGFETGIFRAQGRFFGHNCYCSG